MPKRSSKCVKCDKCNVVFKSKQGYANHKCNAREERYKRKQERRNDEKECIYCGNKIKIRNYDNHEKKCKIKYETKSFKLKGILDFLQKMVSIMNRKIKKKSLVGDNCDEIKNFIFKKKMEILSGIKSDKELEAEIDRERKRRDRKGYIKENSTFFKVELKEEINDKIDKNIREGDKEYEYIPLLSLRQIIYDYLSTHGYDEKYKKQFKVMSDILYKKKDYLTNSEIIELYKNNMSYADRIFNARKVSSIYDDCRNKILNIFDNYMKDKKSVECEFCKALIMDRFNHLKNCKNFKIQYEIDNEKTMEYVIKNLLTKLYLNSKYSFETLYNKYKDSPCDTFLKEIKMFLLYGDENTIKIIKIKKNKKYEYNIFEILSEIEKKKKIIEKKRK